MPTAGDFDLAAGMLTSAVSDVEEVLTTLRSRIGNEPVAGGRLREVIDVAEAAFVADQGSIAARLDELAAEALCRAEACRQYAEEVASYENARLEHESAVNRWYWEVSRWESSGSQGPRPRRPSFHRSYPVPPYVWVEL